MTSYYTLIMIGFILMGAFILTCIRVCYCTKTYVDDDNDVLISV